MRTLTVVILAFVVVVSGCGDQAESPGNSTDVEKPADNDSLDQLSGDSDTPEIGPRNFEVLEIETPGEVEMESEFDVQFTVKNEGDESSIYAEPATFYYTGTSPSIGGGENVNSGWVNDTEIVAPNETRKFNVTRQLPYVGTYAYIPASRDTSGSVSVNPKRLDAGESYTTREGLRVVAENFRIEPNPDDDGFKFGLVDFSVVNNGNESRPAPLRESLELGTTKYPAYSINETGDFGERYFGGSELEPGKSRSGVVEFRLADEYSMENLTGVKWTDEHYENPVAYLWER